MDRRLLHYYNRELAHLREVGSEFAREFPKIASRLGLEGLEVADPYVERLLEGRPARGAARTRYVFRDPGGRYRRHHRLAVGGG